MTPLRIFISSAQKELAPERAALRDYLRGDALLGTSDVFELIDRAIDFVMSKINRHVGTREKSAAVPITYELPPKAVSEAIVNAIAHRDYTSKASVQVMLFSDRLEVWNPGQLPPELTPEKLAEPHPSLPHNPLIAQPLYLAGYIERAGTGTLDMIDQCRAAGIAPPEFRQDGLTFIQILRRPVPVTAPVTAPVTPPVTPPVGDYVERFIGLLSRSKPLGNEAIRCAFGLKDRHRLRETYIYPAIAAGLIEMTIPGKPNSRLQKYRLTEKGVALLKKSAVAGASEKDDTPHVTTKVTMDVTPKVTREVKKVKQAHPQEVNEIKTDATTDVGTDVTMDVAMYVTVDVKKLIRNIEGEMSRDKIQSRLRLKNDDHFRKFWLRPAIKAGLLEMTIPDKPKSVQQRYRLTSKGLALKARLAFGRAWLNKTT